MYSRHLFGDGFYDLYAGRYIVQHGIPHRNVVSSVAHGAPWIDQQWLAHVVFYGAWAAGGYRAVAALSVTLVTSAFAVLALLMRHRGVPPAGVFGWTLAAFAACLGDTWIRAQSFAYPCFALTLWLILEDDRASRLRGRTWLMIPVLVLWANTHGSVLLGAGLAVLYAAYRAVQALARRDRRAVPGYLALGAAAAASVVCTPYGTAIIRYYVRFAGNPVLPRYIMEWAPPSPVQPLSWAFFALALAAAAAVAVAWRGGARPDPLLCGLSAVLLAFALTGLRFQIWFAFGAGLLAADSMSRRPGSRIPRLSAAFPQAAATVFAGLALATVGVLAVTPSSEFESLIPGKAVDVTAAMAASHPGVRVLADAWSGPPMLWLHPALFGRVGFDIRLEQYSNREISDYFSFMFTRGPHWQRVMNGYGLIVVSRSQLPRLASALERLHGWRVVYRDRAGLVLRRQPGPPPAPPAR